MKITTTVCDFCGSDSSDMGKHPDEGMNVGRVVRYERK